jgi:DNA segregation ATPase FtsK/SpoIIIE, S-DNA-T family
MDNKTNKDSHFKEIKGLSLLLLIVFTFLALISFQDGDHTQNTFGLIGYSFAWVLHYLIGFSSFLAMIFLSWVSYTLIISKKEISWKLLTFSSLTAVISCCFLLTLCAEHYPHIVSKVNSHVYSNFPSPLSSKRYYLGGVPAYFFYTDLSKFNLYRLLSPLGSTLIFSSAFIISFSLFFEFSFISGLTKLRQRLQEFLNLISKSTKKILSSIKKTCTPKEPSPTISAQEESFIIPSSSAKETPPSTKKQKKEKRKSKQENKELPSAKEKSQNYAIQDYLLPTQTLLQPAEKINLSSVKKDLKMQADRLEETLASFGIEAKVEEIQQGPRITSFEVTPSAGVKVQKIKTLENDIALNLKAKAIRIVAPIPGKGAVGIEIPNLNPEEVGFKELLNAYHNHKRKHHIPMLLGKAVNGDLVTYDLVKMPHCIIAGATGSGKSVCLNTIIMSILMNMRPEEVRLLMIDPKKVELTPFNDLPHMISPVITEPHDACLALNWLVKEMERRYDLLKLLGHRNILSFNNRTIDKELEDSLGVEIPEKLPFFVGIIDELADLMMVANTDIETPIARIAQMARAVGIHLIIATQRPSREVITGLIKANFPARISFKVASRVNSQIILDETGSESLLGNGDMLFLAPGTASLMRAQGAFIRDEDINKVVDTICKQAPPNYLIESFAKLEGSQRMSEDTGASKDQLFEEAKQLIITTGTASTTFLQRKLKIGYARAASLMDFLEEDGIVGPQEGSKPRRVLSNEED